MSADPTLETPSPPPPDPPSPALVEFMLGAWADLSTEGTEPLPESPRHRARRDELAAGFLGAPLLIPAGGEKIRANDTHHLFRPSSEFFYLTGCNAPEAVLLLEPTGPTTHRHILFLEPGADRSTEAFFTDRRRGELWTGPRLSLGQAAVRYGVDACLPRAELAATLTRLAEPEAAAPPRLVRGIAPALDRFVAAHADDDRVGAAIAEQRLVKDSYELDELRRAARSTKRALDDVLRAMRTATSERELEAAFDMRARLEGEGPGYATIVAAGSNACVLHWTRNDGPLRRGDLVLIDAGVEANSLYTADVTRTFPLDGRYTPAQAELYDLCYAAQRAAIAAVAPGAPFLAPHREASRVLAEGLARLGVLRAPLAEALREDRELYRRYTLHGTSHMLGLDVHDGARSIGHRKGTLRPGMVLTIEPGLYFQPNDLTVPERFRGIGIRLEEDVLVTDGPAEVLTACIPTERLAVERWIAEVWGS